MTEEWGPKFQAQLDKLAVTAQKLNKATDNLNIIIAELEGQLNAICPGVSAYVPLTPPKSIGYERYNGRWRLVLHTADANTEPYSIPLQNASRQDRIDAVKSFPQLVTALNDTALDTIDRITGGGSS